MIRDVIFRNIGERFNIEVSNCEGVMIPSMLLCYLVTEYSSVTHATNDGRGSLPRENTWNNDGW